MVFVFGKKSKARRVPDGHFEKRKCPECGKTTVFRESVVENRYTAYHVVKLWSSESTSYACDSCGALMDLEDTEDPELSAREKKKLEKELAKSEAESRKNKELAQARAEQAEVDQEQAIDDELAQMKKRLGLE